MVPVFDSAKGPRILGLVLVQFVAKLILLETFVFTRFCILSREWFPRVLNVALPVLDSAKVLLDPPLDLVGFAAKPFLLEIVVFTPFLHAFP